MIYCDNLFSADIHYLKNNGFNIEDISNPNDYTFISNIKDNDIIILDMHRWDDLIKVLHPDLKVKILLFLNHEYTSPKKREEILSEASTNYTIKFATVHLDSKSIDNDLSFKSRIRTFRNLFKSRFYDLDFLNKLVDSKRNKKFNMFNRAPNLRRLKAFEIFKKRNIQFEDCYYTFGFIFLNNVFGHIKTIPEYIEHKNKHGRDLNDGLEFDLPFILSKQNEFVSYEDREWLENDPRYTGINDNIYETINDHSLDSYVSFIIESSNDTCNDLRITEKCVRPFLMKNVFLTIGCNGYNKGLNNNGIETFEEFFNLEKGWDENISETEKIIKFVDALEYISSLSKEEVEKRYFSDEIQRKLKHNYEFIIDSFTNETIVFDDLLNN